ncbi:MAG TPA: hypothetical protein VFZ89_17625 [Solirubrobacteraceae bacterium]
MDTEPRGLWHGIVVYFGLRDDAQLRARWEQEGVDRRVRLVGLPLGLLVAVALFSAVVLAVRLIGGDDVDAVDVVSDGTRWLWRVVGLGILVACVAFAVRWVRRVAR